MKQMNRISCTTSILAFVAIILLAGCARDKDHVNKLNTADSIRIVKEIMKHRSGVDSSFRYDSQSPFLRDTSINFTGIKWFPPDVRFYFQSKLSRYDMPETVNTYGTKGDLRHYLKYGYFTFEIDGKEYKVNAYRFLPKDSAGQSAYNKYLSVWFTDETTGKETYHVGRYLDVGEENDNPGHLYTLNFNNAYNPYCAYSSIYSCVIPRREDHIPLIIRAGELKSHD